MKRILIGGLLVLLLSTIVAPVAQAQNVDVTPFNLLNLARNGYFQEQGIPSFNGLETAVKSGQITAESIVQAAIQQKRLPPGHLNDDAFIQSVRRLLGDMNGD